MIIKFCIAKKVIRVRYLEFFVFQYQTTFLRFLLLVLFIFYSFPNSPLPLFSSSYSRKIIGILNSTLNCEKIKSFLENNTYIETI